MSLVKNNEYKFLFFIKIDEKMNVALTRARKHPVILGNRELMFLNPVYRALVEFLGNKKIVK